METKSRLKTGRDGNNLANDQHDEDAKELNDKICENTDDKNSGLKQYEPKKFEKVRLAAEVPVVEVYVYVAYIAACFVMGAYTLYVYSTGLQGDESYNEYLGNGWATSTRLKDEADFEWSVWTQTFRKLCILSTLHSLASLLVSYFAHEYRRHVWLALGVTSFIYMLGWRCAALVVFQLATLLAASTSGSVAVTWIVGFCWLSLYNYRNAEWMTMFVSVENSDSASFGLFFFSSGFGVLRHISFAVEKARRLNGSSELSPSATFSLFDALVYTFYVPTVYTGPMFVYKYFQPEMSKPRTEWTRAEIFDVGQKVCRGVAWMVLCDVFLHLVFLHTIGTTRDLLTDLPLWGVAAMVLYTSSFYQAHYCATYGIPACFMKLDRIVPPTNPRCIARVAYFSEYWRFFDPGLHAFFRNYVYIPLGGSRHGVYRQLFATFVTFAFVSYWHGGHTHLVVWAGCNCVAIYVELMAKRAVRVQSVELFETAYFGPAMTRRIHALTNVPLFIFSAFAIMVFYSNLENGWVYLDRLILRGTPVSVVLTSLWVYSMTMFSHEVERWEQRRLHPTKAQ